MLNETMPALMGTKRAALLLSVFSAAQRDSLISAICEDPSGVRGASYDANEAAGHSLERCFTLLDAVRTQNLPEVMVGMVGAIRADRATTAMDSSRCVQVAKYLGVPQAAVAAAMPKDEEIKALVKTAMSNAEKRKAATAATRLSAAAAIASPSVTANMVVPFYYYLGKTLAGSLAVSEMVYDTTMGNLEIGDPTAEEGDELNTIAAQEVGDAIEEGDSDTAMDVAGGLVGGGLGVLASRAIRAVSRSRRKKRLARRRKMRKAVAASPKLEQDLGTASVSQEPGATAAAQQYVSAVNDGSDQPATVNEQMEGSTVEIQDEA
jgi:hypothetical protein